MPRLTADDFVDADEVSRLDIANQQQLDAIDRELRAAWEAAAVRAAPGASITRGQFNRSFAQMLMILASIGASNELADHPDVHIHYGVVAEDGQVANSSVNWRLIGLVRCYVVVVLRLLVGLLVLTLMTFMRPSNVINLSRPLRGMCRLVYLMTFMPSRSISQMQ